ncbi:MAG: PPE family protein [Mycobacterium sp.]
MDFGALPPEINSARMYSGPGSGPMLAAASAWDQLAHGLNSSAAGYRSTIAGLITSAWQGPSSMMMANAITPYVAWMHSTAAQAEQTSVQAKTAASAYQTAFAMTVPPPLIEANRMQLKSLIASNFFGQNSPAIAATEADYDRMWAQDAAAMYGYAASSSTASRLTPFTDPPRTTDPAGVAAQTAALANSAGSPAQSATPQLLAQLPTAMQQLAAPAQAASPTLPSPTDLLLQIPSITSAAASSTSSSFSGAAIGTTNHALMVNALRDEAQGIGPFLAGSSGPLAPPTPGNVGAPVVSAGMGRASLVGTLSVPQTWAATATLPVSNAAALPGTAAAAAPAASAAMPPGMFGEALLGTLAGRGVSNVAAKLRRPSVVPRSPAAG